MSFYETLSNYYDLIFPININQIHFIKNHIQGKGKVLDLAAGTGNLAINLAKENHSVTAIDLDEKMVNRIIEKAKMESVNVKSFSMDMMAINELEPAFDAITCVGNSIVHLNSKDDILYVLKNCFRLLNKQGLVVIQTVNYDRVIEKTMKELPVIHHQESGVTFRRTYDHINEKIIQFNGELSVMKGENKGVYKNSVSLFPLRSDDLKKILLDAGFSSYQFYGDFKGSSYHSESPAIFAIAKK